MANKEQDSSKLLPLRKFSVPGVYTVFYLSQLVQRKKLRAEKIGRNYFTCRKWFNEYALEKDVSEFHQITVTEVEGAQKRLQELRKIINEAKIELDN